MTTSLTRQAAAFAATLTYDSIPADVLEIARRCMIDGLGVMLAGSTHEALEVAERYMALCGGAPQARAVGKRS